ncbi:MAG: hypothetical protein IT518_03090 [Burkholderiales bacterium]|nr:hypothetical protein [Burkholderiales bacterium]
MSAVRAALLLAVCMLAACSRLGPPQELRVGEQLVSVRLAKGWEAREEVGAVALSAPQTGQSTPMTVHLRDLGPVTPAGYRRELAAIAGLWEHRKADAAMTRLSALRWPRELFPSLARDAAFSEAWSALVRAPPGTGFAEVKADFETVDQSLASTPPLAPAALTTWALRQVDSGARREVTARKAVAVDGRAAEEIETRDTLAQGLPRRILLVPNEGRMLLATTGILARDADGERYEAIRDALKLPTSKPPLNGG